MVALDAIRAIHYDVAAIKGELTGGVGSGDANDVLSDGIKEEDADFSNAGVAGILDAVAVNVQPDAVT